MCVCCCIWCVSWTGRGWGSMISAGKYGCVCVSVWGRGDVMEWRWRARRPRADVADWRTRVGVTACAVLLFVCFSVCKYLCMCYCGLVWMCVRLCYCCFGELVGWLCRWLIFSWFDFSLFRLWFLICVFVSVCCVCICVFVVVFGAFHGRGAVGDPWYQHVSMDVYVCLCGAGGMWWSGDVVHGGRGRTWWTDAHALAWLLVQSCLCVSVCASIYACVIVYLCECVLGWVSSLFRHI